MKLTLECLICNEVKRFETIKHALVDVALVELVLMIFAFQRLHDRVEVYLNSTKVDIDCMESWERTDE